MSQSMGKFGNAIISFLMGEEDDSSDELMPEGPVPASETLVEGAAAETDKAAAEDVAEDVKEPEKIRESTAAGNDKIEILRHELYDAYENNDGERPPAGVDLAIQNLAESTIAAAIIEVSFYDAEGNVVDTARYKAIELRPGASRSIQINSRVKTADQIKSYDVRIVRARTADVEKVQVRSHGITRNPDGEVVVEGIIKNISRTAADTAVVISFYDTNKEEIGRKIIVLRDIEPETIRPYNLTFKPAEGETVGTYSIALGDMAG